MPARPATRLERANALIRHVYGEYSGILEDLSVAGVRHAGGHRYGSGWVDAPGQPTARSLGYWQKKDDLTARRQARELAAAFDRVRLVVASDWPRSSFVPSRDTQPLAA